MACLLTLCGCSDSLRDTYDEYTQGGAIRYLGMCDNLTARPGWQRIIVDWTNNVDPVIKNIKLKWSIDHVADSVILPAGTTEYSISEMNDQGLANENYEISIVSLDEKGRESIETTTYCRPYTYEHESVQSFNSLISKGYLLKDHLILSFMSWQDGLTEAYLAYTKKDGTDGRLDLNASVMANKMMMLDDLVDASKPMYVHRTGELEGCEDLISFEPVLLHTSRSFDADLVEDFRMQYGIDDLSEAWMDGITTVYLDKDYSSFADLLNFSNLKHIVLGSKRYLLPSELDDADRAQDKVYDSDVSNYALKILKELNGVKIDRYNKHYQGLDESLLTEKGLPTEPSVTMINLKNASMSIAPSDENGFNSHFTALFDGDKSTYWEPQRVTAASNYEITIDLKKETHIDGLRLVQRTFVNDQEMAVMPNSIQIKYSNNQVDWTDACYAEQVSIGTSNGETVYVPFVKGGINARYMKVILPPRYYFELYFSSLAELGLYQN